MKLYALFGEELEEHLEPEVELIVNDMEEQLQSQESPGEISLNVLAGNKMTSTIRLKRFIKGRQVSILLDSGSTHSFIDSQILKKLSLHPQTTPPLLVTVADGTQIMVDTSCRRVNW